MKCAGKVAAAMLLTALYAAAQQQPAPVAPQTPETGPVFRTQTTVVTVPTVVTDSHGKRIWALQADDFTITDDGVLQKVRLEDSPLPPERAIAIVVQENDDTFLLEDSLDASLVDFLNALPEGDIPIALLSAGRNAKLLLPFTVDREKVQGRLRSLQPDADSGGPKLLDGVYMAANMLQQQYPNRQKIVLLVSGAHDGDSMDKVVRLLPGGAADGKAKRERWNSTHTSEEVLQYVEAKNIVVDAIEFSRYSIAAGDYWKDSGLSTIALNPIGLLFHAGDWIRKNVPRNLAEATGGEVRSVGRKKSLGNNAIRIAGDFSAAYDLSFHPTDKSPGLHEIRVSTPGRKLRVTSRAFYWANSDTAEQAAAKPPAQTPKQ